MASRPPIRVAITRFEDLLALGLEAALASDPSMSIVAQDIAPERIAVMLRAHRPQVLIVDITALRDPAQVRELRDEHPATHLVLIGERLSGVESAQLLAFGASACLARDTQARDLRHAVHLGSRGLQLQLMPIDARETPVRESHLTAREGEVLLLLRQGRSNAQIALALQIGVETVRSHARNIYRKLGVSSRRTLLTLPGAIVEPRAAPVAHPARRRTPASSTTRRPRRR
ncbi:MAG TPA: response regulator transcription factor [Solirubrobacteraceae bacterium]|nr:response regulator transcription factor [Solirubrobacteraceae bacterium]